MTRSSDADQPAAIAPRSARPWAPRPEVAARCSGSLEQALVVESNGSSGCIGGWELLYPAGAQGDAFEFRVDVHWRDLAKGFESIEVDAIWTGANDRTLDWSPIWQWAPAEAGWITLSAHLLNDSAATALTIRLLLRWSASGRVEWRRPTLLPASPQPERPLRLAAASSLPPKDVRSLADNRDRFVALCRRAGDQGVQLLCLPEQILLKGLPKLPPEAYPAYAVEVPGPHIEPFCEVARSYGMAIAFSVLERAGELIHNTAVLIDADGRIAAKYRKVHLTHGEVWMGLTPGDDFPVTEIGPASARVGLNICKDSSNMEAARMVGRLGAEVLLLPIASDNRADGWQRGPGRFDLERWLLIQRMRAMDNQLYLVAARISGRGSGIFAPDGSVLALDHGDTPLVMADVDLSRRFVSWNGASFRDMTWGQRRESTYGALSGGWWPPGR
ncbi:MAG TPA: carbon-nitrogen hydrolase family protein [Limnochordia bacterium]|nr:carbon-nitrogen hydrolase family protein [Limnochordia bacterium]